MTAAVHEMQVVMWATPPGLPPLAEEELDADRHSLFRLDYSGPEDLLKGINMTSRLVAARRFNDLDMLRKASPMSDAVIDEIDGRRIRIGDQWLIDFASCNYLGFDLDPEIMDAADRAVRRWGTHPSWSRLLGNPRLYIDIEERLTALMGSEDSLVLPTITHIHLTVLPALVQDGTIFVDGRAHRTLYDGCRVAAGQGAALRRYPADDLDELARLLRAASRDSRKVICTDGVNSMTGNPSDLAGLADLARTHDAILYVDDAHGFGVIGERSSDELCSYGSRGNSLVRHVGETYDSIVLVGGFSKAYSSLLAFLALPTHLKNHLKTAASPYLYSGPSPISSLATVLAGFEANEHRGDLLRKDLHDRTADVLAAVRELGWYCRNSSGLPILELPLTCPEDLTEVGQFLFEQGVYVTLAAYPLVPRSEVGFRMQITAANTAEEIDHLVSTLRLLDEKFDLKGAKAV
jgi:7-keto-8-aminopelargonate synthetase-like enzyme